MFFVIYIYMQNILTRFLADLVLVERREDKATWTSELLLNVLVRICSYPHSSREKGQPVQTDTPRLAGPLPTNLSQS